MNKIPLTWYLIIGLLVWGLPAIVVAGSSAIVLTLAAALPVWLLSRRPAILPSQDGTQITAAFGRLAVFTVVYIVLDQLFGRHLLSSNLLLTGHAGYENMVDQTNEQVSQGRGFIDLLGFILMFLPFALVDLARRVRQNAEWGEKFRVGSYALWVAAILGILYQPSSSRGFLALALLAVALAGAKNMRHLLWAAGASFAVFSFTSVLRGDYQTVVFSNPLFDAVGFPFFNLALMLNKNCGSAHWYQYLFEFINKFVPGFIFPKQLYSFNVETTLCIYPQMGSEVESVSIFTYLGEFFYYKPPLVTALLCGVLLGSMARVLDRLILKYRLYSVRLFTGFITVYSLRSRSQDVMSLFIALFIFLLIWPVLSRVSETPDPPSGDVREAAPAST
jgi:hypothetical protein